MVEGSDGERNDMTGAGIEPAARALKVRCSTTELPGRAKSVRVYHGHLRALPRAVRRKLVGE